MIFRRKDPNERRDVTRVRSIEMRGPRLEPVGLAKRKQAAAFLKARDVNTR